MSNPLPDFARNAPELEGYQHIYSGKVRDLYQPHDAADELLVVASDRISAYDYILDTPIPDKGQVLTQLSLWWFEVLAEHGIANHVISTAVPAQVAGRAMRVKKLQMYPIECIARGYLTGSGLVEYRQHGTVCELELPPGLVDGSRLDPPLFTPSAKAEVGEHDENISYTQMVQRVGESVGTQLQEQTLTLYRVAEQLTRSRGIILADTKVEFGADPLSGKLTLGDEVLTPDSSRFWDAAEYEPGRSQKSFDKQFVRDWLTSPESGWSRQSGEQPPQLPEQIVEKTRQRYIQAYEQLTGRRFTAS